MSRKPFLILMVVAALTSVVAAGCGSSSKTTPTSNAAAGSTSGGTTSTPTTSSSSGSGSVSSNPAVVQAVAACKASINAAAQLPAADKTKLTGLCDKAAHGDLSGVKKIAAQVCTDIVNADVPASAGSAIKQQALAACKKA